MRHAFPQTKLTQTYRQLPVSTKHSNIASGYGSTSEQHVARQSAGSVSLIHDIWVEQGVRDCPSAYNTFFHRFDYWGKCNSDTSRNVNTKACRISGSVRERIFEAASVAVIRRHGISVSNCLGCVKPNSCRRTAPADRPMALGSCHGCAMLR